MWMPGDEFRGHPRRVRSVRGNAEVVLRGEHPGYKEETAAAGGTFTFSFSCLYIFSFANYCEIIKS